MTGILARWEALGRPLAQVPRWVAALLLLLTVATIGWAIPTVAQYEAEARGANDAKLDQGARRDSDLYRVIAARVAAGEDYYDVALEEQRASDFPTRPFVAVRLPTLAWSNAVLGLGGWRLLAGALWLAAVIGLYAGLDRRVSKVEQVGAALGAAAFGAAAGIPEVGLGHDIVAGLLVSASLALYRPHRWAPAFLFAACAVAVREMAVLFVIAWLAVAASARRWREVFALGVLAALFAIGLALHAQAVIAHQLPTDQVSPGWTGLQGPALPVFGIVMVTLLQTLPAWLAGPLAILPLLGWLGLGGRLGLAATLWFGGFMLAVALFARQENFYWLALLVPAYGAGLALAPRALGDLITALRGRRRDAAASGSQAG